MDELELDLDTNEEITREKDRNKKLADKVKATSEERDAKAKALEESEARANASQKDAEFYKNFNSASIKYPGANEYQDKIREKVNLGLDVEEATMLIMAKEGKYNAPQPEIQSERAAGGSASTAMKGGDSKDPNEMKQDERRAALLDLEAKGELTI